MVDVVGKRRIFEQSATGIEIKTHVRISRQGRDGIGGRDSKVKKWERDADGWQEHVKADTRPSELKACQARSSDSADLGCQRSQCVQAKLYMIGEK